MKNKDCLVLIVSYNNDTRLKSTMDTVPDDFPYDILIVDDGTTDNSLELVKDYNFQLLKHESNMGLGISIREACYFAKDNGYKIIAMMPGNNKNTMAEISKLIDPILQNKADYVQGSRFLPGSRRDHTPLFRLVMVKVIAFFLTCITFRKITDSMEGFRAFRLSILDDPDIDLDQEWLNRYGLEIYLFFKITKGRKYRYTEVPISKIYPKDKKSVFNKKGRSYSKIRPFVDWWDILRPIFFLWLGIKK